MNTTAVALTALTGVRVKAPLGGNASVHCPYQRGSELYPKYFSKGREKVEMVKAKSTTWSMEGRFSLEDDREKREFTVTIRNLSVDDTGVYWCGVDDWGPDTLTEVLLDVVAHVLFSTESSNTQNGEEQGYVTVPPTDVSKCTVKYITFIVGLEGI
ncbi:CMRF35-like molecule 7 isoform X2 [Colossoma macropomum]|uniref:CMRF35-like molecule 7 isoform X2 n=1 Tax=Colossoma macropomum TaxID=42526 RepID=UPI001864EC6D|nr:CMRF35-like molecule 7 isoform X2 [Colossoma macropomum]